MGKGSKKRPCFVSREEESLRWQLYQGEITRQKFDKAMEKLEKLNAKK